MVAITPFELSILAATVLGEAGGEPDEGIAAVTWAIINRARDPRWPNRIDEVCLQPKQFSVWNYGNKRRVQLARAGPETPGYLNVLHIVSGVLAGNIKDPTNGSNHYHTTGVSPSWSRDVEPTIVIGGHLFYKL